MYALSAAFKCFPERQRQFEFHTVRSKIPTHVNQGDTHEIEVHPGRWPFWRWAPRWRWRSSRASARTRSCIGTIQDLSGPLAGFGKQARNGMLLRIDEVNEQGGIHGRKLKLLVEDSATTPRRPCWPRKSW